MSDSEVEINVNHRVEHLELAQQQSATRSEQMLDRVCQKMEDNYERIRANMAHQENLELDELDDYRRSGPQLSSVPESHPSSPLHVCL